ncbi:nickel/cobalt transporter [Rhizobium sp. CSW-27]|uniref:nickel/cobalt transporter n=1 Tax=Rhizobium sp. CSW-27 TaxID=2839985 RepID=UPI001C0331D4|nr:nickel/cobalt transporter [Rhizobium sp. CSW-27]MBT9369229.1 nickel/cobalt transporter [Rhizobium sp. CSW-27]
MLTRRTTFLILLAILGSAVAAHAQSPLGVGAAEPSFDTSGFFGPLLAWVNVYQQSFYRALTASLRAMREDPSAIKGLVGLSFAYGVFHAAGPGHGKAVISSYMIANETALKRGIVISLLSALVQGLVAILLVAAAFFILRGTGITMTKATWAMEIASFALVALFGVWLLGRKLYEIRPRFSSLPIFAGTGSSAGSTGLRFEAVEVDHDHRDIAPGGYCADCGELHIPDPATLKAKDFSVREAWSAIIAVGLRPCSGAILVMSFSILNGLYLAGGLSVLAMSLGTAITVSILAIIAVTAKDLAVRLSGPRTRLARHVTTAIEILGALFIIVVGLVLLAASLESGNLQTLW